MYLFKFLNIKIALITFLVLTVGIFGFWISVDAAAPINLNIDNYPNIPVPDAWDQDGVEDGFFDLSCLEKETGACDLSPGLILAFLYYGSLWLAGILMFISLLYAGVLYILSGQKPRNRAMAQERLSSVILGAMILFFAVLVFTVINPNIINLQITGQYTVVDPNPKPRIASESGSTGGSGGNNNDTVSANTHSCTWTGSRCTTTGTSACNIPEGYYDDCAEHTTEAECHNEYLTCPQATIPEGTYACNFTLEGGLALCKPVGDCGDATGTFEEREAGCQLSSDCTGPMTSQEHIDACRQECENKVELTCPV
ncbi:MAG: hypothetical protein R3346_00995 [Candidatus Spechtbacterales bacterium]|nr:hypothetical protein [Candidatus Spechtbacterales bacterium]